MVEVSTAPEAQVVVASAVGAVGLVPTYRALEAGKDVALANKETLVMAGELMLARAKETAARLLPIDSEHCALHQCLDGRRPEHVKRLILTASGGPFRSRPRESFARITREEALAHPTWRMGPKITIDSATLMNKGLEVIEARWLFGVAAARIEVIIHPQSIVHSMVEFVDGTVLAQIGVTDMRMPIQYALTLPRALAGGDPGHRLHEAARTWSSSRPSATKFPCLGLAYRALEAGGTPRPRSTPPTRRPSPRSSTAVWPSPASPRRSRPCSTPSAPRAGRHPRRRAGGGPPGAGARPAGPRAAAAGARFLSSRPVTR